MASISLQISPAKQAVPMATIPGVLLAVRVLGFGGLRLGFGVLGLGFRI